MIEDDIHKAVEVLKSGGVILYPTDTLWGIGCDATNPKAVKKIIQIKNKPAVTSFIVLVDQMDRINDYVEKVPDILWDLLDSFDSPTTVIYSRAVNLAQNVIATDGSIGIRVVKDEFCKKLIGLFNKPIVSTSANFSGEPAPVLFKEIRKEIISQMDYVVESNHDKLTKAKASTIIKIRDNGEFDIIRY
jgi:L-threonylcarbamoyladenylate synthase